MFFYVEQENASVLSFSVTPDILSFSQTNQTKQVSFSATGEGSETYTVSSDNQFFSVDVSSGSIMSGVILPVNITFTGNDNTQFGIITLSGSGGNAATVQVNSSAWTNTIDGDDPGAGGDGFAPPPA